MDPTESLTQREWEVVQLAAAGMTDKRVGAKLGIAKSTVTAHWVRIRLKLGAATRGEAIAMAVRAQDAEGSFSGRPRTEGDAFWQFAEQLDRLRVATHRRPRDVE